jgi:hypothetical protein
MPAMGLHDESNLNKKEGDAMITATPRMTNLFLQLGLDSSPEGIERFLLENELPEHVHILEAPFWTPSQAELLRELLCSDANWSLVVDQLSEALRACVCQEGKK